MAELALDHQQWDAFARHLHRVGVAQLMRREPASHSGTTGHFVQLNADSGWRPRPPAGGSA
jgi:hypothetical protein